MQPPDWRIYITPALVAISAIIAFLAVRNTRAVARQKATLDLIEKTESTEHYRKLAESFGDLRKGIGFSHLHNRADAAGKALRRCVIDYLNHYEMVAIGINADILDEAFYRSWMQSAFVRDWNAATPFIQRERWKKEGDGHWSYFPKHFEAYQEIAMRWSPEAINLTNEYSGPPDEEAGPNDAPLPDSTDRDGAKD